MRVAILHDWLTGMRGGERVLEHFLRMYPEADLYTLVWVPGVTRSAIDERVRGTSWLQGIPGVRHYYRLLLPLFPSAARSIRLSGYDLVISLSHAAVKNVELPSSTAHFCYCFTPMRYIWDQQQAYFGRLTPLLQPVLRALRRWDRDASRGVTDFCAISQLVAARIRRFYGRSSTVIHPPIDTSWISPAPKSELGEAFLMAGALVPYKRPELVIDLFTATGELLWVVGGGPMYRQLRRRAGKNVKFFGHCSDEVLARLYGQSRALIFPGREDFGLVPVECLAAGRPVIGVYAGGVRETVVGVRSWEQQPHWHPSANGVWYRPGAVSESAALARALGWFRAHESRFSREACIAGAARFSPQVFEDRWNAFVGVKGGKQMMGRASRDSVHVASALGAVSRGSR